MQPSAIREIFKNMSDPSIIPFAGGNPSQDAFPVKELENIARIIFENNPTAALQYSVTEGYPQLREAAKQFADRREPGLVKEGDGCVITSGAQQAIQLQREQQKAERTTRARHQREEEKERRFLLRQQRRKEKHRTG